MLRRIKEEGGTACCTHVMHLHVVNTEVALQSLNQKILERSILGHEVTFVPWLQLYADEES